MKFFLFLLLVVAAVFGVIAFQNSELEITLTIIQWTVTEPITKVIAVPFGIGLLIGIIFVVPGWIKKAKQARVNKKRIGELEEELAKAQDHVEQLNLTDEETPEEIDIEEDERKGPGDVY